MQSVGIRGSVIAAVATIFVLGYGVRASAQEAALSAGAELAAKGVWNAATTYAKDDIVTVRGSAWIAKRTNTNKVPGQTSPSTAADWQLFARGFNPLGPWSNATKYQPDDLVTHNGQTYLARITNTNKQPPSAANWELVASKGATGATGTTGATGATGPQGEPGPNTGLSAGTLSAPAISFVGDANTGIFSPGAGQIALVQNSTLFLHGIGTDNTALGHGALGVFNSGDSNTAVGKLALTSNLAGVGNTAVGAVALSSNQNGSQNTALGSTALAANTSGLRNTGVGSAALSTNQTGANNTAVGYQALQNSQTADNTAIGYQALQTQAGLGHSNTAVGATALTTNSSGLHNVAVGVGALQSNDTGNANVALGAGALQANTGSNNIAVGRNAGVNPTAPDNSIFIGNTGLAADTTTIKIGTQGTQTNTYIAGILDGVVDTNVAAAVLIDATGKLGTTSSSRRYKYEIETLADVSAMLAKLRPVTFRYKQAQDNGQHPLQYGLIAEEVADVFPDLAVFKNGQPQTVKYHLLPNFLLAGYQAQQKTIAAQAEEARQHKELITAQAGQIASLEARVVRLEAALSQTKAAALRQ